MANSADIPGQNSLHTTPQIDFSKAVDTSNLKDKSIVVTGGANGLGAATVAEFAKAGAYVTILDLNEQLGSALVDKLSKAGHHAQFVKTDATSFASQLAGFKAAISFSPRSTIDIVFPCAGILNPAPIHMWLEQGTQAADADPVEPKTSVMDVNLTGSYYTTHLALHYFKQTAKAGEQSSKHLLYVASLAGYLPIDGSIDYNASKFGVRGMFKALRYKDDILGKDKPRFRVNLIAPSFIGTDLISAWTEGLVAAGIKLARVEDFVAAALRLASDEAISGRAVAIAKGEKESGDRNFDLRDDWDGLDAGKEVSAKLMDGTLGRVDLVGPGPH